MTNLAGIVLCGGRSRRMGVDKHSLPFGDGTMLERVLGTLREVTACQFLVAATDQDVRYALTNGTRLVCDSVPDAGPLEGIAAGLLAAEGHADDAFVIACDVPLLMPQFVERLASLRKDYEIVAIDDGQYRHPLCAVYQTSLHVAARQLLSNGQRTAQALLDVCKTKFVSPKQFIDVDPQLHSLQNINTQDEYQAAVRIAGGIG